MEKYAYRVISRTSRFVFFVRPWLKQLRFWHRPWSLQRRQASASQTVVAMNQRNWSLRRLPPESSVSCVVWTHFRHSFTSFLKFRKQKQMLDLHWSRTISTAIPRSAYREHACSWLKELVHSVHFTISWKVSTMWSLFWSHHAAVEIFCWATLLEFI